MRQETLILAFAWFKAQDGSYRARLERTSARFFDGQVSATELATAFGASF